MVEQARKQAKDHLPDLIEMIWDQFTKRESDDAPDVTTDASGSDLGANESDAAQAAVAGLDATEAAAFGEWPRRA